MAIDRTRALAGIAAVAVVAVAAIGATAVDRAAPPTTPSASGSGPTTDSPSSVTDPQATPTAPTAPAQSPGVPAGTSGHAAASSEVLPTPATSASPSTPREYRLPRVRPGAAPLVGRVLPAAASARGRLVTGFPPALAPTDGSRVRSSSVAVSGRVLQLALVTDGGDHASVLAHYREVLGPRGFVERSAPALAGSTSTSFRRGRDNVTFTTEGERTSLVANLRVEDTRR